MASVPADNPAEVLLVDDEEEVRRLLRTCLLRAGFAVRVAADARAAIAELERPDRSFAAVVTDHLMPGMTGVELAGWIELRRPDLDVVLISGVPPALPAGGPQPSVLAKPFRPAELCRLVGDLIARKSRSA